RFTVCLLQSSRPNRSSLEKRPHAGRRTQQKRKLILVHAASLSALEISASVAFSASLTATPPLPRNPPSLDASATCWLICRSQPLKATVSPGAFASITAAACRSVSMHLSLISAGLLPLSLSFKPSRAAFRPSALPKSVTTALMSASIPGSILAFASSVPLAKLSFRRPHSPLGSAAEIAIPAAIGLSSRRFHSSGVKFDLSVMASLLYLRSLAGLLTDILRVDRRCRVGS